MASPILVTGGTGTSGAMSSHACGKPAATCGCSAGRAAREGRLRLHGTGEEVEAMSAMGKIGSLTHVPVKAGDAVEIAIEPLGALAVEIVD